MRWDMFCHAPALISSVICRVVALRLLWTMRATRLSPLSFTSLLRPELILALEVFELNCHSRNTRDIVARENPKSVAVFEMVAPALLAPTIIPLSEYIRF